MSIKRTCFLIAVLIVLLLSTVVIYGEELPATDVTEAVIQNAEGGTEWYRPENIKSFIEENVAPWVAVVVTAVSSIYVAILPVLVKIKKSSGIFDGASDKLDEAKAVAETAKKQLVNAKNEIEKLKNEFTAVKDGYNKMINGISNIEEIVRLGFGNVDELIVKGYANKIEKVGNGNGKEEKEI